MPLKPSRVAPKLSLLCLGVGFALSTVACGSTHQQYAQTALPAGPGKLWALGTNGYAQFFDGRKYEPYPYPTEVAEYGYDGSSELPVTFGLSHGGRFYLLTRNGELFVHQSDGWVRRSKRLRIQAAGDNYQINWVRKGPRGGLWIQVHARTLLSGNFTSLTRGGMSRERTPTYFTWLGFIGNDLYGFGWDETGNIRAVQRRVSKGKWEILRRFPNNIRTLGRARAVTPCPGNEDEVCAVFSKGFVALNSPEPAKIVPWASIGADWLSGPDRAYLSKIKEAPGLGYYAHFHGRGRFLLLWGGRSNGWWRRPSGSKVSRGIVGVVPSEKGGPRTLSTAGDVVDFVFHSPLHPRTPAGVVVPSGGPNTPPPGRAKPPAGGVLEVVPGAKGP